jgi:hypothetical protein
MLPGSNERKESRAAKLRMLMLQLMVTRLMVPFPILQRKAADGEGRGND